MEETPPALPRVEVDPARTSFEASKLEEILGGGAVRARVGQEEVR